MKRQTIKKSMAHTQWKTGHIQSSVQVTAQHTYKTSTVYSSQYKHVMNVHNNALELKYYNWHEL